MPIAADLCGMARKHPQREIAKILYVDASLTLEQISQETDVSITSLSKWKTEDNWDAERSIKTLTPAKLIERLYEQCNQMLDDAKKDQRTLTTKESDALVKLSATIANLNNRIDASTVMQVFARLNNYIVQFDVPLAKSLLKYEKEVVAAMIKTS